MCSTCRELNIPDALWQNERESVEEFDAREKVYRRFATNIENLEKGKYPASIFPLRQDSYICDSFSISPDDVLYNTKFEDCGNHFTDWGILELNNSNIEDINTELMQSKLEKDGKIRVFTLKLVHKPEQCMYSHTEVHIYEGEALVNPSAPKSIGAAIRDFFYQKMIIHRHPQKESA